MREVPPRHVLGLAWSRFALRSFWRVYVCACMRACGCYRGAWAGAARTPIACTHARTHARPGGVFVGLLVTGVSEGRLAVGTDSV